jgi:hypothetical protein
VIQPLAAIAGAAPEGPIDCRGKVRGSDVELARQGEELGRRLRRTAAAMRQAA